MIGAGALGALLALVAVVGKLSRRLGDPTVDRLYYASYACASLGAVLFVMQGLFGARP